MTQKFCDEPFRLFFPAGILISVIGSALWPLLYSGHLGFHPGVSHARLMIHGFVGSFVIGFLGTSGPRLLGAPRLRMAEVGLLLALLLGGVAAHLANRIFAGDACFLALFAAFGLMLSVRLWRFRQDVPPPGFVLVGLGLFSMVVGTALLLVESSAGPTPFRYAFARLLAYEAFLTLPVLGVSPFLLPRFFGESSGHNFPETLEPTPDWKRRATIATTIGVALLGGWALVAAGHVALGRIEQLLVASIWLVSQTRGLLSLRRGGTMGWAARIAVACLVTGLAAPALAPIYRIPLSHLLYMGGFGLLTIVIATRVIYGHAGVGVRLKRGPKWMICVIVILLIGAATRMSAEFWPRILISHHVYAALCWIGAAVVWAIAAFPKLLIVERDSN